MPDGITQQQLPSPPWTPGPWHYERKGGVVGDCGIVAQTEDRYITANAAPDVWDERAEAGWDIDQQDDADAHLIALAPELAEAVLGASVLDDDEACNHYQGGPCRRTDERPCMGCKSVWGVKDAAEKLRAIGAAAHA